MDSPLAALDLAGTLVFALSGALAGVRHKLDVFGLLVLSFAAATAGGIARDVLIGRLPPAAIANWQYLAVSTLGGIGVFFWSARINRVHSAILVFDAAGLALFAVSGALTGLGAQVNPVAAVMLGVLSAIGGGVARDLLVAEVPTVLRSELYAVAALAGAVIVVGGQMLRLPTLPLAIAGAAVCFGLRLAAIRGQWHLPRAR